MVRPPARAVVLLGLAATLALGVTLRAQAPVADPAAPARFRVRLDTTKGAVVLLVQRDLAPRGADRFHALVRAGYFDDSRLFRVVPGKWAQFGIAGDPKVAAAWRTRTFPDDPRRASNVQGAVAFAWAVADGRTTQVFVNLADNRDPLDAQGFAPFAHVVEGMDVVLAWNGEYGETSGGGIRAGKQDGMFTEGNAWLDRGFPRLDRITRATLLPDPPAPVGPLAQAVAWYTGTAGRMDDDRARALLMDAVETRHPLARMWLARVHARGRMGVERDTMKAAALAREVIAEVERLAADGDLEAMFLMGTAFDEGLGRPEAPADAVRWFERAAKAGHLLAAHNLGNALAAGRGVPKDDVAAVRWWIVAASHGDAVPARRLGEAYAKGLGVTVNLEEARRWYADAADRGDRPAREALVALR
jgi:peptidyl-prolyl cis-trans isomerase A (cyclophilin A)